MKATHKNLSHLAAILAATATITGSALANPFPQQAAEAATLASQVNVPHLVQFSGTLKDSASRPMAGVASVTFAIYSEQEGGTALWSETQNVLADANGHYNVLLGSATANGVPADLFGTGQSRWLSIAIARQPEMPRVLLASVPYALKAADADTLGGLPASAYVTTQALAASSARAATTGGATTIVTTAPAAAPAASEAMPASVTQATPSGSGTTDFIPLWTSSSALGNSILFQSASKIGVGTTAPAVTLDVNGDSIFRGSFQLVPQGTATASTGQLSHSYQWEASTYNSSTKAAVTTAYGFRATPQGNNTASPTSSLDLYYGPGGGTLNDTGLSINNAGVVKFVPAQTFSGASETLTGSLNLPNTSGTSIGLITLGGQSFLSNSGGSTNAFVGTGAGGSAEVAGVSNNNTGVGNGALAGNQTGTNNTASGASALGSATAANYDTAYGVQALEFETTGGSNTAIGYASGFTEQTGAFNTFIGANADASTGNLTHATAIGAGAIVGESNAIVLGGINPNASNVGIGTSKPGYSLEVDDHGSGKAGIGALSDIAGDNAIVGLQGASSGGSNGGYFSTNDFVGTGVVGVNFGGGKAGYFAGNVEVTGNLQVDGTLTKGGGSFKIDDPIAPTEKYLSHSFVESPDMMNIYNGIVQLDAKGTAWVTMPDWFDALNQNFRYQLTSIGRPGPSLFIAREVKNNRFKIAGGHPGARVSWQVTGIRHDAWANAHRIPTEETKPADQQGHYLYPELFGASPDKKANAMTLVAPATPSAAAHSSNPSTPQGQK
jgi:trimeric autotransporter adhesin